MHTFEQIREEMNRVGDNTNPSENYNHYSDSYDARYRLTLESLKTTSRTLNTGGMDQSDHPTHKFIDAGFFEEAVSALEKVNFDTTLPPTSYTVMPEIEMDPEDFTAVLRK